jgi:sugar/nucleoside kinase (ribokinase family)
MAKSVCLGAGLLALDVIVNGSPDSPAYLSAGGSCGNVLTALAYLGWGVAPVARLNNNRASRELMKDLAAWDVDPQFISNESDGSTPIIIHRLLKDKAGNPKHRFEFRDPELGSWLPQYKPVLASYIETLQLPDKKPSVFYFDRASRGTIDLARKCKENNALVYFEPTSISDLRLFKEAVATSDVIKFSSERIADYDKHFPTQQCVLEIRTLGSEGLEYRYSRTKRSVKWEHVKPFALQRDLIKDTAGAGDWCSAGIIHILGADGFKAFDKLKKEDILNALKTGQAYSTLSICFNGARGVMYELEHKKFALAANQILTSKSPKVEKFLSSASKSHLKPHIGLKVSSLYSS